MIFGAGAMGVFEQQASNYAAEVLADNPVAYFRLNDPAGSINLLNSVTQNTIGAPVFSRAVLGEAPLINDGSSIGSPTARSAGWITAPANDILQVGDLTLEIWLRINEFSMNSDNYILSNGAVASGDIGNMNYGIFTNDSGQLNYIHQHDIGINTILTFSSSLSLNDIVYLVVTRNVTTKEVELYIDGSLIQTMSYQENPTGGAFSSLSLGHSSASIASSICNRQELAIYDSILPANRIQAHYVAGI